MTWEWVVLILGVLAFIEGGMWISVWDSRNKRKYELMKDWKGAVIGGGQT